VGEVRRRCWTQTLVGEMAAARNPRSTDERNATARLAALFSDNTDRRLLSRLVRNETGGRRAPRAAR